MRGFFIAKNKNSIYYRFYSHLACIFSVSSVVIPHAVQAQNTPNFFVPSTMVAMSLVTEAFDATIISKLTPVQGRS